MENILWIIQINYPSKRPFAIRIFSFLEQRASGPTAVPRPAVQISPTSKSEQQEDTMEITVKIKGQIN